MLGAGCMSRSPSNCSAAGPAEVSNRTSDTMTVDDLCRARAIAVVLNEQRMVQKLDLELAAIYATHQAISVAMKRNG